MGTSTSTAGSFSTNVTTSVTICGTIGVALAEHPALPSAGHTQLLHSGVRHVSFLGRAAVNVAQNRWSPLTGPGLDHGNDVIYVWLNPEAWYTAYPGGSNNLLWNGYTYDLPTTHTTWGVSCLFEGPIEPQWIAGLDT